jgi:V-type H+-transporting ATPase subunit C
LHIALCRRADCSHTYHHSKLAQDDDFALYTVTIFRKVHDEFVQKAREQKYQVREYSYDPAAVEKQKEELAELEASEKDLWVGWLGLTCS